VGNVPGGPKSRQENQSPLLRRAGLYLGVAFELPGTILGGMVVGYFADDYFGTSPWMLLACTAIAFIGAFARLLQWVRFSARERDGSSRKKDDSVD
jgi:F0F1-type ATP synthase assembly protein I